MVLDCLKKGCALDDLRMDEFLSFSPVFEKDIYEAISMKTCVERRNTTGAPGPKAMEEEIARNKKYLAENK